jgi:ribonuclease III
MEEHRVPAPTAGSLADLQQRLGVTMRDEDLLRRALRHRSAAANPESSNERMEFLGDSVVGAVIAEYLFLHYAGGDEGFLAKAKAYVVSEPALAEAARAVGLDAAIELGAAEDTPGNRARASILSDTFEAVVAAVFLDRGMRTARKLVRTLLLPALKQIERDEYHRDFKSTLQERVQAETRMVPIYEIIAEAGAEHDKTFTARVVVGGEVAGVGSGKSKKQAQQEAARAALDAMGGL